MRYRGFIITSRFGHWAEKRANLVVKTCSNFYCQVYSGNDKEQEKMLDEFELEVGKDIEDMSDEEMKRGIIGYIDENYERLNEAVADTISNRNADLLGRLICHLGECESGEDLYLTLSQGIGMTDDEIRKSGFTSLVPCFDKEAYAQTIAEYLMDEGTANTYSGNYIFDYTDINERFGVALPADEKMLRMIAKNLDKDIVADVLMGNAIDIMFYTQYCPNAIDEETELPGFTPQM